MVDAERNRVAEYVLSNNTSGALVFHIGMPALVAFLNTEPSDGFHLGM
jgi:hypothetical protein